ncbi:hypothetical protein Agub_g10477, partial [Astrephomene gubernaculifera]
MELTNVLRILLLLIATTVTAVTSQTVSRDINHALLARLRLDEPLLHNVIDSSTSISLEPHYNETLQTLAQLLNTTASIKTNATEAIASAAYSLAHDRSLSGDVVAEKLKALNVLVDSLPQKVASLPAVRRSLVASLVLRRLNDGPFEPGEQLQSAERLLLQLFHLHKAAALRKKAVEFTHVSKSGGTSFCQLGRSNGCATESFHPFHNCLVEGFDDDPRYINGSVHAALRGRSRTRCYKPFKAMKLRRTELSCQDRRRRLTSRGYTFYANEYTAFGGRQDPRLAHPCTNMMTVLQLRHPYTRVISHIKHMWAAYRSHCKEDRAVFFAQGHDTPVWTQLAPAPTNNYLIRSLLGEAVFNLPAGHITPDHLELAKAFLTQQYDVLLVLEDADLSAQAMRFGLGWEEHARHANEEHKDPESGLPTNLDMLRRLNRLDLEAYKHGVVMARLDAVLYDMALAAREAEAAAAVAVAAAEAGEAAAGGAEAREAAAEAVPTEAEAAVVEAETAESVSGAEGEVKQLVEATVAQEQVG